MFAIFIFDSSNQYAGFFSMVHKDITLLFIALLNYISLVLSFWTSFLGEEESLKWARGMEIVEMFALFIYDSSIQYAGFFTIDQNDIINCGLKKHEVRG